MFRKKPKKRSELTKSDVDELIESWRPAPLVPPQTEAEAEFVAREIVVEGYPGPNEVTVGGKSKLNFLSYDFLGLGARPELKAAAKATLDEYGCGSCGPRGFYGSVMPHLEVEGAVAEFLGTEGAISYSDAASAQSSTIPAFSKKGDLVVVDGGIHEALQTGVDLSRSKVCPLAHPPPVCRLGGRGRWASEDGGGGGA